MLKPVQVPQVKKGEHVSLQSLSCWWLSVCSVLDKWLFSVPVLSLQQGSAESSKTYNTSMKDKIFTVSKIAFYLHFLYASAKLST